MLTGRDVDAAEAERIGLVSRRVAPEDLLPTCYENRRADRGRSPGPEPELTKRTLWTGLDASTLGGICGPRGLGQLYVRLLTANFEEAVAARPKRAPVFTDEK